MSRRSSGRSTMSRIHDIGGADLALRYHALGERSRTAPSAAPMPAPTPAPWTSAVPRAHSLWAPQPLRRVVVNGQRLTDVAVQALELGGLIDLPDGDYWYDRLCGAWGYLGGPVSGFIRAGLELGGPLQADASGGGTSIFVNGRALHPGDLVRLLRVTLVWPGRYWADAAGNLGRIGLPATANVLGAWRATPPRPRSFF